MFPMLMISRFSGNHRSLVDGDGVAGEGCPMRVRHPKRAQSPRRLELARKPPRTMVLGIEPENADFVAKAKDRLRH